MDKHSVKTAFNHNLAFTAKIGDYDVPMDTSDENTSNFGPSPKKLMLASLAGCTGIDVVSILNKMKVSFSDFSIEIEAGLTDEHPKIYKDVKMIYQIKVAETDQPKMEKAVLLSQDKYCGVSAMFKAFSNVSWDIIYL
jgi:putative redox protein